jgi:hypothetical protein
LRGVFKFNQSTTSDLFSRHVWSAWIDGPLDLRLLERAVSAMRERHALLRTRFFQDGEREMLEVLDPSEVERFGLLKYADLSSLPADQQQQADIEFHRGECFRPLDIEHGEVMSVAVSRSSPTRHRLTVSLHNIVSDVESMPIFVSELCELWRAFADEPDRNPSAILPPTSIQYHHLADYLEQVRGSEIGREQGAFWNARLEGFQPLQLPNDLPREKVDELRHANAGVVAFRSSTVTMTITGASVPAIHRIARRSGATVMSTLVAAMAGYLSQRTSQRDLAFITRLSHRYLPRLTRTHGVLVNPVRLKRTLGFLVNPILLRVSTEGAPSFGELVTRTHAVVTDAFDNGECDLLDLAPHSAFRFCIVYVREKSSGEAPLPLPAHNTATPAPVPGAWAEGRIGYDLLLWINDDNNRIKLHLAYNLELFRDTTAAAFLEGFISHVTAITRDE